MSLLPTIELVRWNAETRGSLQLFEMDMQLSLHCKLLLLRAIVIELDYFRHILA